jgi:hypothetical protein
MNTLPRPLTAKLFANPDSYLALRKHWSALVNSSRKHELSAAHHTLYLALRGKDWRKAFTPITNRRKLENGALYDWGLFRAFGILHSKWHEEKLLAPFDGLVTTEMLQFIRTLLPAPTPAAFSSTVFARQDFPFDAYHVPQTMLDDEAKDATHA